MTDNPFQQVYELIIGAALGLGAWIMRTYAEKIDHLEESQVRLVTREELADYIRQTREERRDMHTENTTNLVGLRNDMRDIHERIDRALGSK